MQLIIQVRQAKTVTLGNVQFVTGKATVTSTSFKELDGLDELVEFMKFKEELKIELAGAYR